VPLERSGLKVISMGILTGDGQPASSAGRWSRSISKRSFTELAWALDHLILDLPRGPEIPAHRSPKERRFPVRIIDDDTAGCQSAHPVEAPDVQKVQVPILGHHREHERLRVLALRGNDGIFRRGGGRRNE